MLKRYEEASSVACNDVDETKGYYKEKVRLSKAALELASADVGRLVKPARMLAAEVSGWLGLERNRLAEVMGYTNVCVLTHWRDELNAALAPFEGEEKGA